MSEPMTGSTEGGQEFDIMSTAAALGFIELTKSDGDQLFLVPGAIYAIEKSARESFTLVKTASEPFGVVESPAIILAKAMVVAQAQAGGEVLSLLQEVAAEMEKESGAEEVFDSGLPEGELTLEDVLPHLHGSMTYEDWRAQQLARHDETKEVGRDDNG